MRPDVAVDVLASAAHFPVEIYICAADCSGYFSRFDARPFLCRFRKESASAEIELLLYQVFSRMFASYFAFITEFEIAFNPDRPYRAVCPTYFKNIFYIYILLYFMLLLCYLLYFIFYTYFKKEHQFKIVFKQSVI